MSMVMFGKFRAPPHPIGWFGRSGWVHGCVLEYGVATPLIVAAPATFAAIPAASTCCNGRWGAALGRIDGVTISTVDLTLMALGLLEVRETLEVPSARVAYSRTARMVDQG